MISSFGRGFDSLQLHMNKKVADFSAAFFIEEVVISLVELVLIGWKVKKVALVKSGVFLDQYIISSSYGITV